MNRGALFRSLRDAWPIGALLAVALLVIETVLAYVFPTYFQDFSVQFLQLEFFQTILRALLGTDVQGMLGPTTMSAMAWVHPVVLALVWTHAIIFCTRVPAGEIDRGTIDVLLGLPLSRWSLYLSETAVFLASGTVLLGLALVGHMLGTSIADAERPPLGRLLGVVANLYCLYVAVGGISMLVSATSDRRGRAISIIFALLITSFLLNFLAQLWSVADALAFLSVLNYYQPFFILSGDGSVWPFADMAVLIVVGAATWGAGGYWFNRRDIATTLLFQVRANQGPKPALGVCTETRRLVEQSPLRIQHENRRDAAHAVVACSPSAAREHTVVVAGFADERDRIDSVGVTAIDGQQHEPATVVVVVQPLHRGHRVLAEVAPGRPELDHDDLAAIFREGVGVPVAIHEREIGRHFADPKGGWGPSADLLDLDVVGRKNRELAVLERNAGLDGADGQHRTILEGWATARCRVMSW